MLHQIVPQVLFANTFLEYHHPFAHEISIQMETKRLIFHKEVTHLQAGLALIKKKI